MENEFWINKVQEECAEVITALCKYRNYGPNQQHPTTGKSNIELLVEELGDLQYCIDQMVEDLEINESAIRHAYARKERKIHDFIGYSKLIDVDRDIKSSMRLQKRSDEVDMDGRC